MAMTRSGSTGSEVSAPADRWTSPSRSTMPGPSSRSRAGEAAERTAQRRLDAAPGVVAAEGDDAGRGRHVVHEVVGVGVAHGLGHRVLLLEHQDVARPSGATVELDPDVEQTS